MVKNAKTQALELIYTLVPELECQRKCQYYCGPIFMTELEAKQIKTKYKSLPKADVETLSCSKLKDGACSIYDLRPLICRLWGTVPSMRCPWGCRPKTKMTDKQGKELLRLAENLSPRVRKR